MKFTIYLFIVASLISIKANSAPSPLKNKTIVFCVESDEWPPYNFIERINNKKTGKSIGFDIDVVRKILDAKQIKAKFKALPWNRCLSETNKGSNIQATLSAATTPERQKKYLYTESYYTVTPTFFYLRKRFPKGINISSPAQLLKYGNICGRLGYSYYLFGLKDAKINRTPVTYQELVNMVIYGRCATFLARLEAFSGLALIGQDYLANHQLAFKKMPNSRPEPLFMIISRNFEYSDELKAILDEGFAKLRKKGELKKILKRYIDN